MTKTVRIENADTNQSKVLRVREYNISSYGNEDIVRETILKNPTDLISVSVFDGRKIVIDEIPNE